MSRPTVVAVLRALRARGLETAFESEHAWTADCPICIGFADGVAPLVVKEVKQDGPASLHCRTGCTSEAILAALGLADLDGGGLRTVRASEVAIEQVRFLVPGRVPLGALTLLCGDPGLGKSTWTCAVAAGATRGDFGEPAQVLMANAEDGAAHVIVPRLAAAGADLERVELFTVPDADGDRSFTIPDDVARLERHVQACGARLVVIDPLAAHLGEQTNAHRDHSVRRALAPLAAMAQRLDVAAVAVVHLNKAAGTDALYRVGGSVGLVGGARSVLLFTRDPDDEPDGPRRALGHLKSNWSALAETVVYEHEVAEVTIGGATVQTHRLALIGESTMAGCELLDVDRDDPPASKRERAHELLADLLSDGDWHRAQDIEEAGRAARIGRRLIYTVADDIGVERERRDFPAVGWWRLPVVHTAAAQQSCTNALHDSQTPATTGDPVPSQHRSCTPSPDCTTATYAPDEQAACTCKKPLPSPDPDGGLSCTRCGRACTDWKGGAA